MASTKKDNEIKLDIPLEGVMAKLQTARVMLQKRNLKKTGKNDFAHFDFFQLEDFLPDVNEIFAKLGLHSEFNITPETIAYEEKSSIDTNSKDLLCITKTPIIKEMATLIITDITKPDDFKVYEMEVAPVMIGNNSRQNIYQAAGGRNTYYKRYLYMNALEIVEDDESDTVLGQEGVDYQQPKIVQPVMQAQPVQNNFVANNIAQPINNTVDAGWEPQNLEQVANTLENAVEEAKQDIENANTPLSIESKTEIMNLVNQKGLNGAEIIGKFCKENKLSGPNVLLEIHKIPLINLINNYNG